MKKGTLLAAIFMAVSFWASVVVASNEITYPHRLNDRVDFYGDFSPSPSARPEVHRADVLQWEYHVYDDKTKQTVEQTAITSFDLKENAGEDFKGFTGYSMIYLPDDPNERTNKIKTMATKYRGNPEFVSRKVEEYIEQIQKGTLPDPIYQTYGYDESGTFKTYNWLSAGHFAYLVGGTDSLDRFGDRCVEFIGKPCGTTEQITAKGFPAPEVPNVGRAMRIITDFPKFTGTSIQQNGNTTSNVMSNIPFGVQVSFVAYSGWETGANAYLYLNGQPIPVSNDSNPYRIPFAVPQSLGKDGEFGFKYSFYRDLTNYKQYLKQGKNTLLISVSDSFERYSQKVIDFTYGGVSGCQPPLLKKKDAVYPISFGEGPNGQSAVGSGGFLSWVVTYNANNCTAAEYIGFDETGTLNTPIKEADGQYAIVLREWEFMVYKRADGVDIKNQSNDPLTIYVEENGKTYTIPGKSQVKVSGVRGNVTLRFLSPYVQNGFWSKATEKVDGFPATYTIPDDLKKAVQMLVNFHTGQ